MAKKSISNFYYLLAQADREGYYCHESSRRSEEVATDSPKIEHRRKKTPVEDQSLENTLAKGEPLYLYIIVGQHVVSSMLIEDEDGNPKPIYHVSKPRTAMKAQAIVEFMSEATPIEKDEGKWLLHVDGSSTYSGSRATVILTSLEGNELEYAFRFDFKASNNEIKYKALKQVRKCEKCQNQTSLINVPVETFKAPFFQWEMDIVGLVPVVQGKRKFLLDAVSYFRKLVEVKPLAKIIEIEKLKFL
ncbi:hypothetical protein Sango_0244200 [Sesamum angolense]|uniref:Reverse transcriptase domain-containing protein n=1 Tax=Sesamum angolense TaxID=2727404 RepID=A0AAE1XH09_9LAMI|nr:hypothetical protein Sango_0244200 [Sesamum angolense]